MFRWLNIPERFYTFEKWMFDGRPKAGEWREIEAVVEVCGGKKRRLADFPYLKGDALVMTEGARFQLADILDPAAELLPLHALTGERFTLANVLPCYDCVDVEASEWSTSPAGERLWIERYQFVIERLPKVSLFKTEASSHILATEGWLDRECEFKPRVEQLGLCGLVFQEIWNDQGREIPLLHRTSPT